MFRPPGDGNAAVGLRNFLAGSVLIDHRFRAAAAGLQHRHAEGFLGAGTDEHVRGGVGLHQLSYIVRSGKAQNFLGKGGQLPVIQTDEDDSVFSAQQLGQSQEVLQTLPLLPDAGNAQDNFRIFQVVFLPEIPGGCLLYTSDAADD